MPGAGWLAGGKNKNKSAGFACSARGSVAWIPLFIIPFQVHRCSNQFQPFFAARLTLMSIACLLRQQIEKLSLLLLFVPRVHYRQRMGQLSD